MQEQPDVVAIIMTQISLNMGLKTWKDKGRSAAKTEIKDLHMQDTFIPKRYKDLDVVQRESILEYHIFLKEKKNGDIKGRTVAGGNKQRDLVSKEDSRSPTVSMEAVLLRCIIDAEEERDVAVIDIPNAFIQTRAENEKYMVYIRVRGILVDLLIEIVPDVYDPYVKLDKKRTKVLILQCLNAIYRTRVASLL